MSIGTDSVVDTPYLRCLLAVAAPTTLSRFLTLAYGPGDNHPQSPFVIAGRLLVCSGTNGQNCYYIAHV